MMHSRCISCQDQSIRLSALCVSAANMTETGRYNLLFLVSVLVARSLFVSGFRNFASEISGPDKSLVTASGEREDDQTKEREKRE